MTEPDFKPPAYVTWVNKAYTALQAQSGFVPRESQKTLSLAVAEAFVSKTPLAAEAPTGTGKTLAYLIGALAAESQTGVPTVVATATKALQQQLLSTDLPRLTRAGIVAQEAVALAKGRSNYLCLRDARGAVFTLEESVNDPEHYMDEALYALSPEEVEPMVFAYESGKWNGDFDLYEGTRPKSVFPIAASSDTCTRARCADYKDCAYFKARKTLTGSTMVVANHDLLLLDLVLAKEGAEGTIPLPNYNVVFDEAHHLPDKAISVGSAESNITQMMLALPKLVGAVKILEGFEALETAVRRGVSKRPEDFNPDALRKALLTLSTALASLEMADESMALRFPRGITPEDVEVALNAATPLAEKLLGTCTVTHSALKEGLAAFNELPTDESSRARIAEFSRRVVDAMRPLKNFIALTTLLNSGKRIAAWMQRDKGSITLYASPLEGADVLNPLLWQGTRTLGVSLVSATLRDLSGFRRYQARVGLPAKSTCEVMESSFNYAGSELRVPLMETTPKFQERKAFFAELKVKLPQAINPKEGTLLLFPSWAMLKEFTPMLRERYGVSLRVQGDQTIRLLVRSHCQAIDRGEGSILAGVATMSEGLDLPGKYCEHVAIMALPFAAPGNPVEEELSDVLGKMYFSQRSLPDAMVRLTQMVGRLLRRESDSGRITIFDRRLASTSYGRDMLRALPNFVKVVEPSTATST